MAVLYTHELYIWLGAELGYFSTQLLSFNCRIHQISLVKLEEIQDLLAVYETDPVLNICCSNPLYFNGTYKRTLDFKVGYRVRLQ